MKKITLALLGAATLAAGVLPATTASALGGCGPNGHRNFRGVCVFGGQNQDFCIRRTGHRAGYGPHGERICRR